MTFLDAESWLAERGIERDPIEVAADAASVDEGAPASTQTPPSAREVTRLANEQPVQPPGGPVAEPTAAATDDDDVEPTRTPGRLEDEVADAMTFIRRSTTANPSTENRLRDKLRRRDVPAAVIDAALTQARGERLVDDRAMAHALTEEWLAKGHAPFRVKRDLVKRGIPEGLAEDVLEGFDHEDPEARAFGVARDAASRYRHLEPDAQFRRLVGYLARRGHHEGTARKVAREVVFADREDERTSTR